jgi:transglutaminase-like putative cysteine protease
MSRGEFRGALDTPRPAAAWLMSAVASAALWVTEQLPFWVIGLQCLAFVVSFVTREAPPAFRRSPIWLNVFMVGITTVTIRSALAGNPATISLAYFTSLAQGLQLLDARPRKSEFVLVALALFQVILASNLTDSVFFPPLLIVFLASVTWTLLVHTLAMEATEAGDPAAASRAIAPDLRRMTALATLASLVLAGLLFVTLPRLRTNMLRGAGGPGLSIAGFSDRVALGDVGRIRQDGSVVLRVEAIEGPLPEPAQAYWRGLAFDHFDGTSWSISRADRVAARKAISGIGRFGIDLRVDDGRPRHAQRILREPVEAGVLFADGEVQRIEGPFQRLERDRNEGLYVPGRGDERIRYSVWSRPSERDAGRLRRDRAVLPMEPRPGGDRPAERYLQLPTLDPRVAEQARRVTRAARSDFDRALAIRDHLRKNGRYTDAPPPLGDATRSPVEAFVLGDLEGHCEYFASAMVVLSRSEGLPSRLVNGFAGGLPNDVGGFVEVSSADAHAWVEIHFEDAGWVRFDPTPVALRLRAEGDLDLWQRLAQVGSAIELWWFQRVVDFDSADQIGALRSLWLRWKGDRDARSPTTSRDAPKRELRNPFADIDPLVFFGLVVLALAVIGWWQRPRTGLGPSVPADYLRAQRILARGGLYRAPERTARAFAVEVSERLPPEGGVAFDRITTGYLAERFGARPADDLANELADLERAVDRMRLGDQADVR